MAKNVIISTPRGTVYTVDSHTSRSLLKNQQRGQTVTARLSWNRSFSNRFSSQYSKAQKFVDSEVLRGCSALVPFQTGALQKSGVLGTDVGSGEVAWIAPYAHDQYYNTPQTRGYDPNRGAYWFERWKASDGGRTIKQAKKLAGGG